MIARFWAVLALGLLVSVGCSSSNPNTLSGSESQVYNLTFDKVIIVLQGTSVSVKYASDAGDPAILVVDTAEIVNVANSTIDLTQLVLGQPRGVLQNVNGGGDGVTNQLMIMRGTAVFDQVPTVGKTLTGQFNATLTDGFTLNGTFSSTVNAP